ncbi:MAG: insulinase family protein [Bacteroidetes bacterium]|nr:MAG: insulinase family protein [Bacteroidota bacterium]
MVIKSNERTICETFPNDPFEVSRYTLPNGLRLFLSVNKDEPRIFTNIAFRAGSKYDPADTTGLAHYMEHMLFKGTSRIGALDWEQEKIMLQKISDLYETYRATDSKTEREAIYQEIDKLSYEAAKLVAPNEYDKLVSALGANHTNAYTWVEQTVYVNDIPSNELERWMMLESERFKVLALRLFHTELETVYEEFNIGQDNDTRQAGNAMRALLFPNHPYGTQTTIGKAEHLRNPSMKNIQEFFETYYVANNMAIVLSGDFDPDEVVKLAEKYFGSEPAKEIPPFKFDEQPSIKDPVKKEVLGKESSYLEIAWRMGSSQTDHPFMMSILSGILYNNQAGLLDINLNQAQKVLDSESWAWFYEDYSVFGLYGKPREGQSLEDVEGLLLKEVEKLKKGEFEDWLLEAVIKDLKLNETKSFESNSHRVGLMTNLFILNVDWARFQKRFDFFENLTKEDIVNFANQHLNGNHAVVYKKQGESPDILKVDKPPITPVELNRHAVSDFGKEFLSQQTPSLQPVFADFKNSIQSQSLSNGISFDYVHNKNNGLFRVDYIFEMGRQANPDLGIAMDLLLYQGTEKYSREEIKKEFFRLGLNFETYCHTERSYLSLMGLDESLEEGMALMEHILHNAIPDQEALDNVIADILIKRENDKQDRSVILREGLLNFAKYGAENPFTTRHSVEGLKALKAEDLTEQIRSLTGFEHRVYYYGPKSFETASGIVEKLHHTPSDVQPCLVNRKFKEVDTENVVYFLNFPIVQTDVMLISKGTPRFNLEEYLIRELYNEYFGYGLSSIVFQEIRESKALAYSTYAYYGNPKKKDRSHYLSAYVGTQPDKLKDAIPAMKDIIEDMPLVDAQIEQARHSIHKRLETDRIAPSRMYWEYRSVKDLGHERDLFEDVYNKMKTVTKEELSEFHQKFIKGRKYALIVLGDKERVDLDYLSNYGEVRELSMKDIFGY